MTNSHERIENYTPVEGTPEDAGVLSGIGPWPEGWAGGAGRYWDAVVPPVVIVRRWTLPDGSVLLVEVFQHGGGWDEGGRGLWCWWVDAYIEPADPHADLTPLVVDEEWDDWREAIAAAERLAAERGGV